MNVKLISITQPLVEGLTTAEELITYCARVSNPSNQLNTETAPMLLKYCIKHKHFSIFEQADMTVEVKTSRAIAAQILRHRSFTFQEYSQRYSSVQAIEPIELRKQGATNRQSSSEVFDPEMSVDLSNWSPITMSASKLIEQHIESSLELYNDLLDAGVARECARMILPLTVETTMYMKGSVRSWITYLQVRNTEDTQLEHRLIAQEIQAIFKEQFPNISEALGLS